jgi:hypothetical protein
LPTWKIESINNLGFGLLNKLILYFEDVFWDKNLDYFGNLNETQCDRGEFYLIWNFYHICKKPVLIALISGKSAYMIEKENKEDVLKRVLYRLTLVLYCLNIDLWKITKAYKLENYKLGF